MLWRNRGAIAIALVYLLGTGGCGQASELVPPLRLHPASGPSRTFVIVLENRESSEVIGASDAPVLNRLAHRGALLANYYAIRHPSLPNYLAILGGSTFGVEDNCTSCRASGPSLATQLAAAGVSWRAYMGGLPRPCYRGAESGDYVKKHNPFMYFPSIAQSARLCHRVVPESTLLRKPLPRFAWIGPDLCDDAHSCDFGSADRYLGELAPRLLRRLGPHGLLVVTFDEGTSDAACCGNAAGGRVATILVGPDVRRGVVVRNRYTHYSLLTTLEDRFGLARLRQARRARPLNAAFRAATTSHAAGRRVRPR
jgi:hypothetical protein